MVKYRTTPMKSVHRPIMIIVAPRGRVYFCSLSFDVLAIVNSCTSATPVDAIARLVRTYARNVR